MNNYNINSSGQKGFLYVSSSVSKSSIERAEKALKGITGGIDKAMKNAIHRAADNANTNSSRFINEIFDISINEIKSNQTVITGYNYSSGNVEAVLRFAGRRISLIKFNATTPKKFTKDFSVKTHVHTSFGWQTLHPSISVKSHIRRGDPLISYVGTFTGKRGVYKRINNTSDEIRTVAGPSVPKMLSDNDIMKNLTRTAYETFEKRLDHEVIRLLNGYGG